MRDIQLSGLSMAYKGKTVLINFSLTIPAGVTTCIMAPSGAGKTTLLRILMGLEQPQSGKITGLENQKISAVFQEDRLCMGLNAPANIRLPSPLLPESQVLAAMEEIGLYGCAHQPVRELSGGMKRRVAILRGLLADWDVLFLDEPFAGLDQATREAVMEFARKICRGRTVLLVTHDITEARGLSAATVLTPDFAG